VASYTFTNVTANHTISATFAIKTYTITATAGAGGSISPSGAVSVNCGANKTFNITADSCWNIADVSVDSVSQGAVASYTFTNVTANHTISATFSAITYTLTVNVTPSGGGNVTVNGTTPLSYPNSTTWVCGNNVTLNATAASGYSFVNWSGDLGGSVNPTNITMTSIKDVTAHFSAVIYNLTVTSNGCCPINVSGAVSGTVPAGGNKTFMGIGEGGEVTVSADDSAGCCKFDSWSDAGAQTHNITMDSDKSVTAYCSVPSYDLTVNVSPGGGGNVTVNGTTPLSYPNMTTWNCGENVTLNAVAASGYSFVNWTGNLTGSTNPTNITMNGNKSITANFALNQYNLTVNVTPSNGGSVTVNGTTPTGYPNTTTWNNGDVVTLNAAAASGYHFVNWTGSLTGSTNPTNITMNDNKSVTANFAINRYNLNTSSTSGGNVTTPGEGVFTYDAGTVVNLVATADANYHFVNWTGDVGMVANVNSATTNITMTGNYSITANFAINRYNLNISSTSGGNVTTPGEGTYTYDYGTVVSLVATADANYHFVNWTGDVGTIANVNSANTNITMNGNYSIVANFAINRYNRTTSSTSGGNVTAPGEGTYTYNASQVVSLVATADANYHFVNWTGNVGTVGNVNSATTNITMTGNYSITANFAINRYNLNISSSAGGNVTTPGEGTYTYNASQVVSLVATADANYDFVNWTGNVGTIANVTSATTNITMNGNYSIVANFEVHEPKICVNPPSLYLRIAPNTTVTTTYTITNCGGGTLNWDSSNVTYVPNGNMTWLTQNITSGTLTANASQTVLLTVNTTGLAKGTYNAFITITGSTFIFPIILDVTGPYTLTINSTAGGNVTTPAEGTFTYNASEVVDLVATADANYTFVKWTGDVGTVGNVNSATTNITMNGNYSIVANFNVIGYIDVMRNLPDDAEDPDAEYPGDWFWVYVNFTAPVNEFNSIGLTDLAPAGWEVETDINWCSPNASWTMSPGNKAEYSWSGESKGYNMSTPFSARYKVTIPATASPGYNYWPNCNISEAWVEYWFGPVGPYKSCITGDYKKIVTVPGEVWGETRDVNADLLTTTLVVLSEEPPQVGDEPEDSDSSTEPDALYKVDVDDTGQYWLQASKYCYFTRNTSDMPVTRNPWHADYINFTTVELLAANYTLDFEGDYGLVPKACTMAYAMKSVNHWLFIPLDGGGSPHPEWQLSNWKAMESIHSWQFPCGCNT
jgi:uncharacterized repeat protein (TIGR02543 family)